MVFAVVTGGGTSGHVIPARAILEALQESGHGSHELRYVGTTRGIETELMRDFGVECAFLPISGLQRSFTPKNIVRNLVLPYRLFRSRLMARALIDEWKPRVVVSVGGYASEPMARAAIARKIPLVCVSYDRMPGLATRRQAQHATVCTTAFDGVDLPRAVVVGAPVRAEMRHLNRVARRESARAYLGIPPNALTVAIVGGSLGSGALNSVVPQLLKMSSQQAAPIAVFHVCGERFAHEPLPAVPEGVWYRRVGYESNMADVYSAADLLVARAGASTVAEVATIGIAAVVVPWSGAADAHQDLNARWLVESGGAVMATDEQCENGEAVTIILNTLLSTEKRESISRSAWVLGALHRGNGLVEVIQNAAH